MNNPTSMGFDKKLSCERRRNGYCVHEVAGNQPEGLRPGDPIAYVGTNPTHQEKIASQYVRAGTRALEIGCGTGTLTLMMAQRGATVTGIDASPRMLAEAEKKIKDAKLEDHVTLKYMDAALIGDRFPAASFDLIVSTLVFSELPLDDQRFVLEACQKLLAPNGRLLIADEVIPARSITRLLFYLVRLLLVLLTWLITRTTTNSLRGFDSMLTQVGFRTDAAASHLGGSLVLYESFPAQAGQPEPSLPATVIGRLQHRVTLRTLLLDLWLLFFRIIRRTPNFGRDCTRLVVPTQIRPCW